MALVSKPVTGARSSLSWLVPLLVIVLVAAVWWLASRDEDGPLSRITLLVMNAKGYRTLTELISRGFIEGQRNGEAIAPKLG